MKLSALLLIAALPCASLSAQSTLHWFQGEDPDEFFGTGPIGKTVDFAGDVDGDGFDDVIVGSFEFARVFSGADGSLLYEIPNVYLGVGGAGDVDQDGFDDFMVLKDFSAVRVISGATGHWIRHYPALEFGDSFGLVPARAGDVNNDGVPDHVFGCQRFDQPGYALVYSGADGSLLHTFFGDTAGDGFGFDVDGVGDLNGDGYDDVAVGASEDGAPLARVFSGADGSVLLDISFPSQSGYGLAGPGDMSGDGVPDVATSSYPAVQVWSGADGSLLHEFDGFGRWDGGLSPIGDLDADGFADLLVLGEAPFFQDGGHPVVRAFSGSDGSSLLTIYGQERSRGQSLGGGGDANGDGWPDIVAGNLFEGGRTVEYGGMNPGLDPELGLVTVYGGGPALLLDDSALGPAGTPGTLAITGATPGAKVVILGREGQGIASPMSTVLLPCTAGGPAPLALGEEDGFFYQPGRQGFGAPAFRVFSADAAGTVAFSLTWPTRFANEHFRFQAFEPGTCRVSNLVLHDF